MFVQLFHLQYICCSLKCNPIFGNDLYLVPSRQYIWMEYFYEDKINKISVGQKWMRKNEMLLKLEMRHFEVNYDISEIHKKPCGEYFIQPKKEHASEYNYSLIILDCDTISKIQDINLPPNSHCPCQ
mgnify:CR=1 FL=1